MLMLEFMASPVEGLDELKPHFTWTSAVPQASSRVNITNFITGDLIWTSGRVESAMPLLAVESELPLGSDMTYSWTVETWPQSPGASLEDGDLEDIPNISKPGEFTTGLLNQTDWGNAEWIDAGACEEAPGWK